MAEELDVSWFDLSKYDALDELDLSEWHTQLEVRNVIANIVSEYGNDDEEFELLSEIRKLQQNPIWRFYDGRLGLEWTACPNLSAYPFNSYSVYSTPALHVWCDRYTLIRTRFFEVFYKKKGVLNDKQNQKNLYTRI